MRRKRCRKIRLSIFLTFIAIAIFFIFNQHNFLNFPFIDKTLNTDFKNNFSNNESLINIHILDVGKADSIYINCEEKNILIDASEYVTREKVVNYLKRFNVKNFDLVVATHPHSDHIGGMSEIIKRFSIDKFLMPKIPEENIPTSKTYEHMLRFLKEKKVLVEYPFCGDTFFVGPLKINILAPCKKSYENLNNYSIVLCVNFKDKNFLFMGDAEKESENDILSSGLNLKSDFIKIGHHGSKTSTNEKFLNKVLPKFAAISTVSNSRIESVLSKLKIKKTKVFRTDINGTIIFSSDGGDIKVSVEKTAN